MVFSGIRATWRFVAFWSLSILMLLLLLCFASINKAWASKIMRWGSARVLAICGLRVHVSGRLNLSRPSLVVANHVSYADVAILGALFGCGLVAKAEVGQWPLIGTLGRLLGCVFVKRERLDSRVKCLNDIKDLLKQGKSVAVFPQGTTSTSILPHSTYRGQSAAAQLAGVPIVAVGIHYLGQPEVAWTGDDSFLPHFFKFLKDKQHNVFVSISSVDLGALSFVQGSQKANELLVQQCQSAFSSSQQFYSPRTTKKRGRRLHVAADLRELFRW